jgi:hypothetical protein
MSSTEDILGNDRSIDEKDEDLSDLQDDEDLKDVPPETG